jgi:predicted small secreted protein
MAFLEGVSGTKIGLLLSIMTLLTTGLALSACHTAHGFGQDVSGAGHAVTHSADEVRQRM